ncbi:Acyl carrier protein [Micromonospora pattaloongensis]|uniref:Acyl carrier protein n=1 Tax=Micromonospora pattaloongensis TaxID=405436 RepID=A0A1H3PBW1_9ACTN|nr:acyl carrier protein [Micromonospora pattaloongensis]SDY98295.1 Acyl carrier protein [Micromonospora pattaloongensis]
MTTAPARRHLAELPPHARWAALENLVVEKFRAALLLTPDENLPLDENYFGLGLTSLGVTEIKQTLEAELGCEIDTSALFHKLTVADLLDHLTATGLSDLFPPRPAAPAADDGPDRAVRQALVRDLLHRLYEA